MSVRWRDRGRRKERERGVRIGGRGGGGSLRECTSKSVHDSQFACLETTSGGQQRSHRAARESPMGIHGVCKRSPQPCAWGAGGRGWRVVAASVRGGTEGKGGKYEEQQHPPPALRSSAWWIGAPHSDIAHASDYHDDVDALVRGGVNQGGQDRAPQSQLATRTCACSRRHHSGALMLTSIIRKK
jgi:hypothetical protein